MSSEETSGEPARLLVPGKASATAGHGNRIRQPDQPHHGKSADTPG
ncbi:MAG: hypothetical protein LBU28_10260 [Spirochaetaceae bacterium]|jgi:hypothetical protein|nr:hypothetical protein [Spirochaetaceae bacterium]